MALAGAEVADEQASAEQRLAVVFVAELEPVASQPNGSDRHGCHVGAGLCLRPLQASEPRSVVALPAAAVSALEHVAPVELEH